jgi:hypothetical protein
MTNHNSFTSFVFFTLTSSSIPITNIKESILFDLRISNYPMRPQEIAQPKTQENTYQLMKVLNDSRYNLTDHRRLPNFFENQKTLAVRIIMTIWAKRIAKGSLKLCKHRIDKISPRIIPLLIATFASFNSVIYLALLSKKSMPKIVRWHRNRTKCSCIFQNHISSIIQLNQRQRW